MAARDEPTTETFNPLDLHLDPQNPRLGRRADDANLSGILEIMIREFKIEELAESIATSGFVPLDPMVGWRHDGAVYVLEGNRRLAALQLLLKPDLAPLDSREKWRRVAAELDPARAESLKRIGVLVFQDRDDPRVASYIGFRHVTGVLSWPAYEKARFIVGTVETRAHTFTELGKRLGNRAGTIEKHYLAYKIVQQAIDLDLPGARQARDSFGVLIRSLNSPGVVGYLSLPPAVEPARELRPVPAAKVEALGDYLRWTFGADGDGKVVTDSRLLTRWGRILQSPEALAYLKRTKRPEFERAWARSGGESESLTSGLFQASDRLREAVPLVPAHFEEESVSAAIRECVRYFVQILPFAPAASAEFGLTSSKPHPAESKAP